MTSGRYSAYPKYKDSELDWLGLIPWDWTLNHVKHIAPFQVGWTPPTKSDANFEGDNLWANISDLKSNTIYDTAKRVSNNAVRTASMSVTPKGSLLYSFKLSVGTVSFAGNDMFTNEAIASFLDTAKLPLAYLFYALPKFVIKNASTNIYGANILNQELIRDAYLLAPTYGEAEQIAKFLDHETAKIDHLIEMQQALIALLNEKRQAVISYAVTKGLNPHASLKDSGIESLGETPSHWRILRLKNISPRISGRLVYQPAQYFSSEGIPFLMGNNVTENGIDWTDVKLIPETINRNFSHHALREGDVITVRVGAPGVTCVVPKEGDGLNCGSLMIIRHADSFNSHWLARVMNSPVVRRQIDSVQYGAAQEQINITDAVNFLIPTPPLDEQTAAVRHLDAEGAKFDALTAKARRAITLLQERRTALISAAVTGTIDVRAWQRVV